jgi:hypothetical protein
MTFKNPDPTTTTNEGSKNRSPTKQNHHHRIFSPNNTTTIICAGSSSGGFIDSILLLRNGSLRVGRYIFLILFLLLFVSIKIQLFIGRRQLQLLQQQQQQGYRIRDNEQQSMTHTLQEYERNGNRQYYVRETNNKTQFKSDVPLRQRIHTNEKQWDRVQLSPHKFTPLRDDITNTTGMIQQTMDTFGTNTFRTIKYNGTKEVSTFGMDFWETKLCGNYILGMFARSTWNTPALARSDPSIDEACKLSSVGYMIHAIQYDLHQRKLFSWEK